MSESEWIEVSTKSKKLQKRQESKKETKTKKSQDQQSMLYSIPFTIVYKITPRS